MVDIQRGVRLMGGRPAARAMRLPTNKELGVSPTRKDHAAAEAVVRSATPKRKHEAFKEAAHEAALDRIMELVNAVRSTNIELGLPMGKALQGCPSTGDFFTHADTDWRAKYREAVAAWVTAGL